MSWLKTPKQVFFVKSDEQNPCPICGSLLKVIGSRRRCYFQDNGERRVLMIRRLRCSSCNRIHHELPDLLVPYKRYESQSIEAAVTGSAALTVAADEATISRWKQWFSDMAGYFAGVLISIATRYNKSVEEYPPFLSHRSKGSGILSATRLVGWPELSGLWRMQIIGYRPVLHSCPGKTQ
jgi:hypothetical protein